MRKSKNQDIHIALIMAMVMLITMIAAFAVLTQRAEAISSVTIGQATNGEGGKLKGCSAGDQTGKEVSLSGWNYGSGAYNWKYVFRAKDPSVAKKLAASMQAAADNSHVGYDQNTPDRNSLYDEAEKVEWDISQVTTNCETTCGSLISVCINAAGITVPRTWYSEIIPRDIMLTDEFDCFTSRDYVASSANLLPGDILVSSGHSAMVVESPNKFKFKIVYTDEKGEEAEIEIEEGSSVFIDYNNGKEKKELVIEDKVDLNNMATNRKNDGFSGWTNVDDTTFTANYTTVRNSIPTSNKNIKTIKN